MEQNGSADKAGETDSKHIDNRAANDLIHTPINRQDRVESSHPGACKDGGKYPDPGVLGIESSGKTQAGGTEHHALNSNVDDAATLAQHPRQGTKGNGRGQANTLAYDPQDLKPSPDAGPGQNDGHKPEHVEDQVDRAKV